MIVRVLGVLDGVLDQLLQRVALAHKLDELGNAATAAEHDELLFLKEQLFNSAALFLVQDLVDLNVSSTPKDISLFYKNSSDVLRKLTYLWLKIKFNI